MSDRIMEAIDAKYKPIFYKNFMRYLLDKVDFEDNKKKKFIPDPKRPYIVSNDYVQNYFTLYESEIALKKTIENFLAYDDIITVTNVIVKPLYEMDKYPLVLSKIIKSFKFMDLQSDMLFNCKQVAKYGNPKNSYYKSFAFVLYGQSDYNKRLHVFINNFWDVQIMLKGKIEDIFIKIQSLLYYYYRFPRGITMNFDILNSIDNTDIIAGLINNGYYNRRDRISQFTYEDFVMFMKLQEYKNLRRIVFEYLEEVIHKLEEVKTDGIVFMRRHQEAMQYKLELLELMNEFNDFDEFDISL